MRNCLWKQKENGLADSKLARVSNKARHLRSLGNVRDPRGRRYPLQMPSATVPCCLALLRSVYSLQDSGSRRGRARAPVPDWEPPRARRRAQGEGEYSGKDPIAFWSLCQKQTRDLSCLPSLLPPLPTHPPLLQTWLPTLGPSLSVTASAHNLCRSRATQTSPPGAPLQQHLPFLCASPRLRKGPSCHSPP